MRSHSNLIITAMNYCIATIKGVTFVELVVTLMQECAKYIDLQYRDFSLLTHCGPK